MLKRMWATLTSVPGARAVLAAMAYLVLEWAFGRTLDSAADNLPWSEWLMPVAAFLEWARPYVVGGVIVAMLAVAHANRDRMMIFFRRSPPISTGAETVLPPSLTHEEGQFRSDLRKLVYAIDEAHGSLSQIASALSCEAYRREMPKNAALRYFFMHAVTALPTPRSTLGALFDSTLDQMDSHALQLALIKYLHAGYMPLQVYVRILAIELEVPDATRLAPVDWLPQDAECVRQLRALRLSKAISAPLMQMSDDVFGTVGYRWRRESLAA